MRLAALLPVLFVVLLSVSAEAQDDVEDIREQLKNELRSSDIGAGYAQMLNFFIDPSISASRLEADDGTDYDVFKVPLQTEFPLNDRGWEIAIRGTLSHARAENLFEIFDGETIEGTWEAYSGQVGAGLIIPATDTLSWYLAGQLGISQLENTADYGGGFSEVIIAPIADGILFNWDTNARIFSLGGGLDYEDTLAGRYDFGIYARYTHSYIESYSESRDLVPFEADTGTFSTKADLRHPYSIRLGERPLFGVVQAGVTALRVPIGMRWALPTFMSWAIPWESTWRSAAVSSARSALATRPTSAATWRATPCCSAGSSNKRYRLASYSSEVTRRSNSSISCCLRMVNTFWKASPKVSPI